jgi:hypothetical protein
MDPIAAVSLVATICQLIDFSSKVISNTHEIYNSSCNSLAVNNELSQVASQIFDLSEKLRPDHTSGEIAQTCHTRDEQALVDICNSCNDVAMELFQKLGKLRDDENASRWSSFRKAIRHAWSDRELEDLSRRLSALRGALELNVLVNLRYAVQSHDRLAVVNNAVCVGRILGRNSKISVKASGRLPGLQPPWKNIKPRLRGSCKIIPSQLLRS